MFQEEERMRISDLSRFALNVCAVGMLAGCGAGSGAPLSPSLAGLTEKRTPSSVTYEVLYSFRYGSGDGEYPYAGLLNVEGTLYGTTFYGGANGYGTVFSITRSGTETVLYSFRRGTDGDTPYARLVNVKGKLYGTTWGGGTNNNGTVFSITRSGAEAVLHRFKAGADGEYPYAGVLNVKGTLYGTTVYGGATGDGTVFKITPSGTESVLYNFQGGTDGDRPYAGLVNVKGTLYGTTNNGGANGLGTVFSIAPSGAETVLYSFKAGTDGALPEAGLTSVKGTLYGTTWAGGASGHGTVFSITPSGAETVLYSFKGSPNDGNGPLAALLNVGGTLYGTTSDGGSGGCVTSTGYDLGCGTVFSVTPSGTESLLYSFKAASGDGRRPEAGLISVKGRLYGTTVFGGATGGGTVFSLTP